MLRFKGWREIPSNQKWCRISAINRITEFGMSPSLVLKKKPAWSKIDYIVILFPWFSFLAQGLVVWNICFQLLTTYCLPLVSGNHPISASFTWVSTNQPTNQPTTYTSLGFHVNLGTRCKGHGVQSLLENISGGEFRDLGSGTMNAPLKLFIAENANTGPWEWEDFLFYYCGKINLTPEV